jgi:hypothetical protein
VTPVESGVLIDEEFLAQLSSLGAESVVHHSCVLSRPLEWSTGYFNDRRLASLPNAQRLSYSKYKSCDFTRSTYRYHRTHCLFFQAPISLSLSLSLMSGLKNSCKFLSAIHSQFSEFCCCSLTKRSSRIHLLKCLQVRSQGAFSAIPSLVD